MFVGAPVDSKYLDWQPTHVTMTDQHIIAASEDTVYVWQYRTSVSKLTSVRWAVSVGKSRGGGGECTVSGYRYCDNSVREKDWRCRKRRTQVT